MSSSTMTLDPELKSALKKLKLGKLIDTLPERLVLATKNKMTYQELLLLVLRDEIDRRVHLTRADDMLRRLKQSRLDNSREALMVELTTVDLLIIDDFALEPMTRDESRDIYQLFVERNGRASTVVTSNRDTSEWIATFDDVLLAQSAVDRFINNVHDLVIEGESYRPRLKPTVTGREQPPEVPITKPDRPIRRRKR